MASCTPPWGWTHWSACCGAFLPRAATARPLSLGLGLSPLTPLRVGWEPFVYRNTRVTSNFPLPDMLHLFVLFGGFFGVLGKGHNFKSMLENTDRVFLSCWLNCNDCVDIFKLIVAVIKLGSFCSKHSAGSSESVRQPEKIGQVAEVAAHRTLGCMVRSDPALLSLLYIVQPRTTAELLKCFSTLFPLHLPAQRQWGEGGRKVTLAFLHLSGGWTHL